MDFIHETNTVTNFIRERFIRKKMSLEAFQERIEDFFHTNGTDKLELFLIAELCKVNAFDEAMYWVYFYNVAADKIPECIKGLSEIPENPILKNKSQNFYSLRIREKSIEMIDSIPKLSKMLDKLVDAEGTVGIDAKWKKNPDSTNPVELAIIQIATKTNVYIIDLKAISVPIHHRAWRSFFSDLLINPFITKIGYDAAKTLTFMFPYLPYENDTWKYVDLKLLSKQIYFGNEYELSQLVDLCFNKQLNEEEHLSNWEKRPLRKAQQISAAVDAYCVFDLYESLKKRLLVRS